MCYRIPDLAAAQNCYQGNQQSPGKKILKICESVLLICGRESVWHKLLQCIVEDSVLFFANLEYFTWILIFGYFTYFQFFRMSFDSSNAIIHRFDAFCRGIPIIALAAIKAINNHQGKNRGSALQIFYTPHKATDVVANSVV